VARTVRHESIVIRKITIVITRPTSGSATGTPAATAAALTTTPASAHRCVRCCGLMNRPIVS
jgi:hypothetical protein